MKKEKTESFRQALGEAEEIYEKLRQPGWQKTPRCPNCKSILVVNTPDIWNKNSPREYWCRRCNQKVDLPVFASEHE